MKDHLDAEGVDLLLQMLRYDPNARISVRSPCWVFMNPLHVQHGCHSFVISDLLHLHQTLPKQALPVHAKDEKRYLGI